VSTPKPVADLATRSRAFVDEEMIRELLARQNMLVRSKEQLQRATEEIADIDGKLAVITEELQAYGYVEPQVAAAAAASSG
jgi:hypothetical protein